MSIRTSTLDLDTMNSEPFKSTELLKSKFNWVFKNIYDIVYYMYIWSLEK